MILDSLSAREVTLTPMADGATLDDASVPVPDKAVTFTVGKLLPMEAKKVFMEHVRPLLRGALGAGDIKAGEATWLMALAAFTDAPQLHYDAIVQSLYRHIVYKRADSSEAPSELAGDEENAFSDLDMAHILMLDVRAFIVNFRGSWRVVISEFPALDPESQSSGHQT